MNDVEHELDFQLRIKLLIENLLYSMLLNFNS